MENIKVSLFLKLGGKMSSLISADIIFGQPNSLKIGNFWRIKFWPKIKSFKVNKSSQMHK